MSSSLSVAAVEQTTIDYYLFTLVPVEPYQRVLSVYLLHLPRGTVVTILLYLIFRQLGALECRDSMHDSVHVGRCSCTLNTGTDGASRHMHVKAL